MYEFTLASVYNVNRIPVANAKEYSHICSQVVKEIIKSVIKSVIKTVSSRILADDALIIVALATSENGLAKHGCIELHCG